MPHVRDTDSEDRARQNFADWVERVLADHKSRGISKSGVARLSGINRNDIDRWLKKETFPLPKSVRKFCDNLELDYAEPARILGWNVGKELARDPVELSERIRRAKLLASQPETSEQRRRELEQQIRIAEQARQAAASSRLSAEQMERTAEALLREALGEHDTANEDATDR